MILVRMGSCEKGFGRFRIQKGIDKWRFDSGRRIKKTGLSGDPDNPVSLSDLVELRGIEPLTS
jgi:hypothetical protein